MKLDNGAVWTFIFSNYILQPCSVKFLIQSPLIAFEADPIAFLLFPVIINSIQFHLSLSSSNG